jgi:chromosome segregation ATPase
MAKATFQLDERSLTTRKELEEAGYTMTNKSIIDEPVRTEQSYIDECFTQLIKGKDGAINSLQNQNTELLARNRYLTERVLRLREQLRRLTSENLDLDIALQEERAVVAAQKAEIERMTAENNHLQTQAANVAAENVRLMAQVAELEAANKGLGLQNNDLWKAQEGHNQEIARLMELHLGRIAALEAENARLRRDNEELCRVVDALTDELERCNVGKSGA